METGLSKKIDLVQDASFTKEVSSEHVLCIEFDNSSYKLGVFNASNNALVTSAVIEESSLATLPLLSFDYGTVLGVCHSKKSFLSHEAQHDENTGCVKISALSRAYFHHSIPELPEAIKDKFPQIRVFPFGANFISGALQKNRYQSGQKLYVHLADKMLYLMHFSDNKFMMYSSETLTAQSEALYYISKAIELTNFNQLESKIYLSGEIIEGSEIYTYITDRVKNVYLNKGFKFQKAALSLSKVEKQKFFSIINTFQCA